MHRRYFTPIMKFLGLCRPDARSAIARFVYIKDTEVIVLLITTLCIVLDLIGLYEGNWLFEVLHFVTVCLDHFSGEM